MFNERLDAVEERLGKLEIVVMEILEVAEDSASNSQDVAWLQGRQEWLNEARDRASRRRPS